MFNFAFIIISFQLITIKANIIRLDNKMRVELNPVEKSQCFNYFQSNVEKYFDLVKLESSKRASEEDLDLDNSDIPEILPSVIRVIAHALSGNISGITEESFSLIPLESQKEITNVLQLITNQFKAVNQINQQQNLKPAQSTRYTIIKKSTTSTEKSVEIAEIADKDLESTSSNSVVKVEEKVDQKLSTLAPKVALTTDEKDEEDYDETEVTSSMSPMEVLSNIRVDLFPEMMVMKAEDSNLINFNENNDVLN